MILIHNAVARAAFAVCEFRSKIKNQENIMIRTTKISAVLLALLFSTGAMAQSSGQPSAREANGGERAFSDSVTAQNPASTMQKDRANKKMKKVNAKAERKAKKAKAKSGDMRVSPPT